MTERFLLDTHYWLWLINESPVLKQDARHDLLAMQSTAALYVCAFSVWELSLKESVGKLEIPGGVDRLLHESFDDNALQIAHLTPAILVASNRLPGTLHGDPADRILVATARDGDFTLLTRDNLILKYAAKGHVRARKL